MKRSVVAALLFMVVSFVACVTINIYFPAEEVRNAADKIVNEVWGERPEDKAPPTPVPGKDSPQGSLWKTFGPDSAYAAQDINVSTPEIRAIKEAMKKRAAKLLPFLDSGNVGIGLDGFLEVRSTEGLGLKDVAGVKRLVSEENDDRLQLYREIARANGLPGQEDQVQAIFAESWRAQAAPSWYLKQTDGSWKRKQ